MASQNFEHSICTNVHHEPGHVSSAPQLPSSPAPQLVPMCARVPYDTAELGKGSSPRMNLCQNQFNKYPAVLHLYETQSPAVLRQALEQR